jgi:histidine ammonia-lyase
MSMADPIAALPSNDSAPETLDGVNLTVERLVRIARNPSVKVELDQEAMGWVKAGETLVSGIAAKYEDAYRGEGGSGAGARNEADERGPVLDYGVTTGFGEFKRIAIDPQDLKLLQRNILLSHAVGVGESSDPDDPSSYFAPEVVRAALALRINAFLKGNSGVTVELVERLQTMLNSGIVPLVPIRGSVGSSGDLCPLSHLFVVLLEDGRKEGRFVVVHDRDGTRALDPRQAKNGRAWEEAGLAPLEVTYKEGLALTNGAAFSTAILALAVHDAIRTANTADIALTMSVEAARGCARAFDRKVHEARPFRGQRDSARNVRCLLQNSKLIETFDDVQDPYSLRCAPQVHGASRDTIAYARMVVECEMNSATDNPLFFPDEDRSARFENAFQENWKGRANASGERQPYDGRERDSYSAGNFHGQPVGLAADFLAIALAELANISERRTQMLVDGNHNRGLPTNLIPRGGVNSGFMIAQYAAAGIVSENKVLCHPASVDSIPTSSNSEDHNSMSTIAARKLRTVLGNTQAVLAMELLVAAQAIEWATARAHQLVDTTEHHQQSDTVQTATDGPRQAAVEDAAVLNERGWLAKSKERRSQEEEGRRRFEQWVGEPREPGSTNPRVAEIAASLGVGARAAYTAIRAVVPAITTDVLLEPHARAVRGLVEGRRDGVIALVDHVDAALAVEIQRKLLPVAPLHWLEIRGDLYADC